MCKHGFLITLLATVLLTSPLQAMVDPDTHAEAIIIGKGSRPAMAIDDRGTIHLVYTEGATLYYRTGNTHGDFSLAEEIDGSIGKYHDPRVVLDKDMVPHVVFSDGYGPGAPNTFYTNRCGDSWKPVFAAITKTRYQLDRCTMPHCVVDHDGTVFVSCFTVGGPAKGEGNAWGFLVRIETASTMPAVTAYKRIMQWTPQLFIRPDGTLWVSGRDRKNRKLIIANHDKQSLVQGETFRIAVPHSIGESHRASIDDDGEIHVASTANGAEHNTAGRYNTLSRARSMEKEMTYRTTNTNANGAGMPVRDKVKKDRVYVLYWSGTLHDQNEPPACAPGNQLRFARFDNYQKMSEEKPVTSRTGSHGSSHRTTPCMVAHPSGGMIVVFEECDAFAPTLFFTTIGVDGGISVP